MGHGQWMGVDEGGTRSAFHPHGKSELGQLEGECSSALPRSLSFREQFCGCAWKPLPTQLLWCRGALGKCLLLMKDEDEVGVRGQP